MLAHLAPGTNESTQCRPVLSRLSPGSAASGPDGAGAGSNRWSGRPDPGRRRVFSPEPRPRCLQQKLCKLVGKVTAAEGTAEFKQAAKVPAETPGVARAQDLREDLRAR